MTDWQILQQVIGIDFRDPSLLEQALVHSSYINENPDFPLADNERLEFLGDALLGFIVTERLYRELPHMAEGELTKVRVSLVRQDTLALAASTLKLGDYLHLGKGEESTGGRYKQTNLADVFEALIGAIFLDQGLAAASDFVLTQLSSWLDEVGTQEISTNYKALLQEFTQAEHKQLPTYRIVETSGPDHNKDFTVEVTLGDRILGTGSGKSKKTAEMEAARSAWEKLKAQ